MIIKEISKDWWIVITKDGMFFGFTREIAIQKAQFYKPQQAALAA